MSCCSLVYLFTCDTTQCSYVEIMTESPPPPTVNVKLCHQSDNQYATSLSPITSSLRWQTWKIKIEWKTWQTLLRRGSVRVFNIHSRSKASNLTNLFYFLWGYILAIRNKGIDLKAFHPNRLAEIIWSFLYFWNILHLCFCKEERVSPEWMKPTFFRNANLCNFPS